MRTISVIKGDGIGPEIMDATLSVLTELRVPLKYEFVLAGKVAFEKYGDPLPEETFQSLKRNKVALKGPTETPLGSGYQSVNVKIRQLLNTYANVRPVCNFRGIPSVQKNVDVVVIRENLEGTYTGIEAGPLHKAHPRLRSTIKEYFDINLPSHSAIGVNFASMGRSTSVVSFAFEYARRFKRKKITCVHKANIHKEVDGLFMKAFDEVRARYPEIEANSIIVDNAAQQLVMRPERFDVLVCPNLYGDILSDLCAGLVGGLGVVPGANIGDEYAVFEPAHGTAPDIVGLGKANPAASMLSSVMMLEYLGEHEAGRRLTRAIEVVFAEGICITQDLKRGSGCGTEGFTGRVLYYLQNQD